MAHRIVCTAVALMVFCATSWVHADQAPEKTSPNNKRTVYVVKYGMAYTLADILHKHFKDDATIQIIPEASSNCLLISCKPAVFDEVSKLLGQIDRRSQLIAVDIWIADIPAKPAAKEEPGAAAKVLDEKELGGPIDAVQAKLLRLQNRGKSRGCARCR